MGFFKPGSSCINLRRYQEKAKTSFTSIMLIFFIDYAPQYLQFSTSWLRDNLFANITSPKAACGIRVFLQRFFGISG